jgi:hypothetical protein
MSTGELDSIDGVAAPVFLLGSLTQLGLLDVGELPIIGDPTATFVTLGDATVTVGIVLALVALGTVIVSNEWELDGTSTISAWAVVATVGLLIGPPFLEPLAELTSSGIGQIVSLTVQSTGYAVVSYLG